MFQPSSGHLQGVRINYVVPKVWSADPKGCATSSQGIRGYFSVMATLKVVF